ncbi:hypothetical protein ACN47E_003919 [Coniothyrium glycines]
MAPRRGGGGGSSSGSSISSCPGAFTDRISQVYFACVVLYFAVFLVISIATCMIRKRTGTGKKLIGGPYIIALFIWLIAMGLEIVTSVLRECGTVDLDSYYSLAIATTVFYRLAYWALLFVAGYVLNIMLRKSLGSPSMIIKVILLAVVGIVFALSCALIGVTAYNNWTQTSAGYDADAELIREPADQLRVAYAVLFLITVLITGGLSVMTVLAMRAGKLPGARLLIWVVLLAVSMLIWVLIDLVFAASFLHDNYQALDFATQAALNYVQSFFQALSFVFLLCIAKHSSWNNAASFDMAQNQPVHYVHDTRNVQPTYHI